VTIRALTVPEPVPRGSGAVPQALSFVTRHALELVVNPFERIVRELCVGESSDREGVSDVTRVTLALGRSEPELPGVGILVAARTLARRPTVRSPSAAQPVLFRGTMATVTSSF
jgi:hypothetical protein